MWKKDLVVIVTILMGVIWFSESQSSPFTQNKFEVSIKASRGDLDYVKLKADYRTLKKGRYCKGAFISYGASDWVCDQGSTQKCTKKYRCKRVNRNFNLKTESRRIRKEMAQTGMVKPGKHKIWISRKPVKGSQKVAKARSLSPKNFSGVQYMGTGPIRGVVAGSSNEKNASLLKKKSLTAKEVMEKKAQEEAMAELQAEAQQRVNEKIAKKGFQKAERVSEVRKSEAMDELDDIEDDEYQEAMDIADDSTDSDIDLDFNEEEASQVAEADSSSDDSSDEGSSSSFSLLAFSGGFVSISSETNSLSTLEAAWTPRLTFGSWGIRGHYGFHQFTVPADNNFEEELFMITDMKIMLFKYLGNFILEAGVGSQNWGGKRLKGSFSTVSGTLGYKFGQKILKAVDRLYLHFMQIGTETTSTSIEVGIGVTF